MAEYYQSRYSGEEIDEKLGILDNYQLALAKLGSGVRPNLLYNAYFVGGGSQQGGGQLPINQRGKTSYSELGYTIDKWQINGSKNMSFEVQSTGCLVSFYAHSTVNGLSIQNKTSVTDGKTITASILSKSVTGNVYARVRYVNESDVYVGQLVFPKIKDGINFATGVVPSGAVSAYLQIMNGDTLSSSVILDSAKIEEGDNQTLAYQDDDGTWKIIPQSDMNFTTQLLRCQRYLWASAVSKSGYSILGQAIAYNDNTAYLLIDLPITPRNVVPSIVNDISASLYIRNTSSISGVITSASVDNTSIGSSKVLIVLSGTFTAGATYLVYSGGNNPLILSWEI